VHVKVLKFLNDPFCELIPLQYPTLIKSIEVPSTPVVLELTGLHQERLTREDGGRDLGIYLEVSVKMEGKPGVNSPSAFRVNDLTPSDIVAVHDLQNWSPNDILDPPWRPDCARVAQLRREPKQWLAEQK
jgi:hypothetical protein